VHNLTPLLSSAEKSVTLETNKIIVNDISTPCLSACVDTFSCPAFSVAAQCDRYSSDVSKVSMLARRCSTCILTRSVWRVSTNNQRQPCPGIRRSHATISLRAPTVASRRRAHFYSAIRQRHGANTNVRWLTWHRIRHTVYSVVQAIHYF